MEKYMDVFDWQTVLIDNYRKHGLKEEEVCIILVVDSLLKKGTKLVTPDLISLKMNLDFATIDSYFTGLIKKKLLQLGGKEKLEITIEPLKRKLLEIFYEDMKTQDVKVIDNKELSDVLVMFENEFSRALTQFEVDTIKDWLNRGYKFATIKEALNVAKYAKVKTIRYIDSVLLEWERRDEIAVHGQSALSEKWRKNIHETMEIARVNWMEDD